MTTNHPPTFRTWYGMKNRCLRPNLPKYPRYGGRGITICERWMKFENFVADMGERPDGLTLDRINNDGNYEPGNCRWASRFEQQANTRRSVLVEYNGKRQPLSAWSREVGVPLPTLSARLRSGMPPDLAFTLPAERGTLRTTRVATARGELENTKCERCGNVQQTVKPWKHVPRCRRCHRSMRLEPPK